MGSLRFDGVLFAVYSHDHPPPHVHAVYGEMTAVLELLAGGGVSLATRAFAFSPPNAKRSDLRRVIRCAEENERALRALWEDIHERG